jgi:alpha-tubulin suppressor-like RCC1 family protein
MKRLLATVTVVPAAAAMLFGLAAGASAGTIPVPRDTALHWGEYFGDHKSADGDETTSPAPIALPAPVRQLATSNSTQYALLANGQVWAWGQGTNGQLGDGGHGNSFTTAVQVRFPAGVSIAFLPQDANPYDSAMAVDTSGQAWGWGLNKHGEFCNGTTRASDVPEQIPLPGHVTTLAGANAHALYDAGGTVYTCGANHQSQADYPVPVKGLPPGVAVAELVSGFGNAGALLANGQYYDWGDNAQGQLGNGTTSAGATSKPQHVSLPAPVAQVYQGGSAPGNGQTLVILTDGALYAWGANAYGQLGTGDTGNADAPVPFSPPAGVTYATVATGGATSYAIDTHGNVWAWGEGAVGELGNGTERNSRKPVKIISGAGMVSTTASSAAAAGPQLNQFTGGRLPSVVRVHSGWLGRWPPRWPA